METLNMLYGGDIYQFHYDGIKIILRNHYSRVVRKKGRSSQSLVSTSTSTTTIKHEM